MKIQIYRNNINVNFNNDFYNLNRHNFRNFLCIWMWCILLISFSIRVFGFQTALWQRAAKATDEISSSSAHTSANPRACILRLRERGGDERLIPSIGWTREKLIEKHFDDTMPRRNKRDVRQPGPGSSIYRANAELKFEAATKGTNAGDMAQESVDNESQYGG